MKKTFLFSLIISTLVFVTVGSCTREKISPLEGAWKLAYEYELSEGKSSVIFPGISNGSEIKIWSGDKFALVGVFIQDSTFTDNFGGGTFTLDGTRYEEKVQYHSAKEYLGQTVKLFLEIKNDTITQIWPVDEKGQAIESGKYYIEKWVRMK